MAKYFAGGKERLNFLKGVFEDMSYGQMVDLLRMENRNEVVFVKTGAFYALRRIL